MRNFALSRLLACFALALVSPVQFLPAFASTTRAHPANHPGQLASAEPVTQVPPGTQAWRIAYWSTDGAGRPQRLTGMVVAPRGSIPASPRSVIAWTHGTWGVVEKCGPSLSPNFFSATPALADMVRRGYVVVAPDYPGLGTSMPHPYLIGSDTARSVLDSVRAARSISNAAAGSRFAVWGESQGGHAALWTASQVRGYAPDLDLVGTAAAAPPTDLPANFRAGRDANVQAMLSAFTAYSWSQKFGLPLSTLFNRATQGVVGRLARNNCITLGSDPKLGTILGVMAVRNAMKNKDMGRLEPWAGIARRNSVAASSVPGPVLIAQSVSDPVVGPEVTRQFARQLCRAGRPVRWVSIPGGDHAHSARDSAAATLDWIDARFARVQPASDCDSI